MSSYMMISSKSYIRTTITNTDTTDVIIIVQVHHHNYKLYKEAPCYGVVNFQLVGGVYSSHPVVYQPLIDGWGLQFSSCVVMQNIWECC